MKCRAVIAIAAMTTLIASSVPAANPSAAHKEPAEIRAKQTKEDRIAAMALRPTGGAAKIGGPGGAPYTVDIGVYGMVEPPEFPSVTWIKIACFSTPGVSYDGFSLMWVDILIGHDGGRWDSRAPGNNRGICDLNNGGVDTTIIEIPRWLRVRGWTPYIASEEQWQMNVRLGHRTSSPVHIY